MIRRVMGVVLRPRATFAALAKAPNWMAAWGLILLLWALCGGWLLSTDVGQQALVDEQVRVMEGFGGEVSDAQYAALQRTPPWWIYFTSGGRLLLMPVTTLAIAVLLSVIARSGGAAATLSHGLAIAVYASVALLIGQVVATPLHYVRESLTSPLNLAVILPALDEGSLLARFFGTIDVFAVWWIALLAIGLAAVTGQRAWYFAWRFAAVVLVFAAITATIVVVMGGA